MLAFAVWSLWSVVVVNLDKGGFHFSKDQWFWLTALPAVSGATLRIFYSFLVPIFDPRHELQPVQKMTHPSRYRRSATSSRRERTTASRRASTS